MENFIVENVMNMLREDIRKEKLCSSDLSFTTYYHHKSIQEFKTFDRIILFGAGRYGEIALDDMLQHGIDAVRCFCDNSAAGSSIKGVEVISPKEAAALYPNVYFVITPKDYQNEMLVQLVNMGISVDHIRLYDLLNTGLIA